MKFLLLAIITTIALGGKKGIEPRFIAVYFGDGTHYDGLSQSEFDGFEFYKYSGMQTFRYEEEQKLMGNPNFLTGLYGELPEKMMFGSNNRLKKRFPPAHRYGSVFLLSKGLIMWQAPENGSNSLLGDMVSKESATARKLYKKMLKGKAKVKPAKKPATLKKSKYGELEASKGSKLDKNYAKMLGQSVPAGIQVIDDNGKSYSLNELTAKGDVVLVFFHMNDIPLRKKYLVLDDGATKDIPVKINHKPMDTATFEANSSETMLSDGEGAKSAFGAMSKMAMGQVKREISNFEDNLLEGDKNLLPRDAVALYKNCTAGLRYVTEYLK